MEAFPIAIALGIGAILGAVMAWQLSARALTTRLTQKILAEQANSATNQLRMAEDQARTIVRTAEAQADKLRIQSRDEALKITDEAEETVKRRRIDLDRETDRLNQRREELDKRFDRLDQREHELTKRQSRLDKLSKDAEQAAEQRRIELEHVSQMTTEQARAELMGLVEKESRADMARKMRQAEEEVKAEGDRRARDVIALAIQRIASDQVSDLAVSVVTLPSEEMKGRVIGRNGRNIRAFEQATGVDVVVDDTPEAVTLSSFDPIRREIARRTLLKLIGDGRIHPARIEKLVEDTKKEVDQTIREEGEAAAFDAGVPGLHPEIIKLLGRLKFRYSYGQNQHGHSIETAHIAGIIAAELGANVEIAKAGGLLHDIGKAIDHEIEGTHAMIGAEFAKRYGVSDWIVNAIASHHHEVEQTSVESIIVEAADAISGARPGARRESLDAYVKRVKMLEELANSFEGVEASYALQAGREVRIIVQPDRIDDLGAMRLARDIARKIEDTMQYPGQIKVQVIREMRATDTAK